MARDTIKIMTLNAMHARAGASIYRIKPLIKRKTVKTNLRRISDVLDRESPDVALLQEIDDRSIFSGYFSHVEGLAQLAGYPHNFFGEHVKMRIGRLKLLSYGTALLSKHGFDKTDSYQFYSRMPVLKKGFVYATIRPPQFDIPIDIISVHFSCIDLLPKRTRRSQAEDLIRRIRTRGTHNPVIIGGDFNCEWRTGEDALEYIAKSLGLVPYVEVGYELKTFPAKRPRLCLDWVMVSPSLEVRECYTLPDKVSDHLPVIADIGLRK